MRLTQVTMIVACIFLLIGFLQTRDENDRRDQLVDAVQRLCLPQRPGDRAVAEIINGRMTCITYTFGEYGRQPRVVAASALPGLNPDRMP